MFNFTTTNVINSLKDSSGKDLLQKVDGGLNILRVNNFKKENVESIYFAAGNEAKLEQVKIDLSKLTGLKNNDQLQLNVYIGLTQASQDSRYSNDMIYKGKPFTVEFLWKGQNGESAAADTAAALLKTINKYQVLVYGDKQLDASVDGSTLTLTAKTEYQRFKTVNVDLYEADPTTYPYTGKYTNELSLGNGVTLTAGKEGFGTYSYLLHNLRLPTFERTRFMGLNQDEAPVVGALYDQFTIHYCVNRGPLGLNAVGDSVKSVTTHVFYVKQADSATFKEALSSNLGTVTDAKKKIDN